MPVLTPYALAAKLLGIVRDGYLAREIILPDTQYVAPGSVIAYDTEQLTVQVTRIFGGLPGAEADKQDPHVNTQSVELQVCLVRGTPMIKDAPSGRVILPTPEELDASAQENLADAYAMRRILVDMYNQSLLVDRGARVVITPVTTAGPMGGVVATVATVQVQLM